MELSERCALPASYFIVRPVILLLIILALARTTATKVESTGTWMNNVKSPTSKPYQVEQRVNENGNASFRLPKSIQPQHYDLYIHTNIGETDDGPHGLWFKGRVRIQFLVTESTPEIRLHTADLDVDENSVVLTKMVTEKVMPLPYKISNQTFDSNFEQWILHLVSPLEDGVYHLLVEFKANLTQDLDGFYLSSYQDEKPNNTRWLGVTQFQPTGARRAFPCFDEPGFKSTFNLSILHFKGLKALSNMPAISTKPVEEVEGYLLTTFGKTVPMPTYLLAWLLSDFEVRSAPSKRKETKISIWTRRNALEQTVYSTRVAPKILKFFEGFLGEKYPLPKMDLVAIPDFDSMAMENWGLITSREDCLLIDPNESSSLDQLEVVTTITHEFAHQWFGNLVTMEWWSGVWLNEGFASYLSELATDYILAGEDVLQSSSVDDFMSATRTDSLKTTRPIYFPVNKQNDIEYVFDDISYLKGSALVRMMNAFLGKRTFRKGLLDYIRKHRYGVVEQDDLWGSFSLPLKNLGIKQIMDTWTLQPGFPLVTVTRDYRKKSASVTQVRYYSDPSSTEAGNNGTGRDATEQDSKPCWYVPLKYITRKKRNYDRTLTWMRCDAAGEAKAEITQIAPDDEWVIFNANMEGYYRVQYDAENWRLLANALLQPNHGGIPEMSRVQLVLDALALAHSGHLDYRITFDVINYLRNEKRELPLFAGLEALNSIERLSRRTEHYNHVLSYLRNIHAAAEASVKANKKRNKNKNRVNDMTLEWACQYELATCRNVSLSWLRQWMEKGEATTTGEKLSDIFKYTVKNPIPIDLREAIYCNGIHSGSSDEWEFMWQQYQKSNVESERQAMLKGLACSSEPWVLHRYLEYSISNSSGIRRQDAVTVFTYMIEQDVGFSTASEFLWTNFTDIWNSYPARSRSSKIGIYFMAYARQVSGDDEHAQFSALIEKRKDLLQENPAILQAQEIAQQNVDWRRKRLNYVVDLMKESTKMFSLRMRSFPPSFADLFRIPTPPPPPATP